MADLPSYQPTGRVFSDLPQLDFANVRESFKQSQALSNQLDRLSAYAFTEMGKTTAKQAEQFALDNPITIDQLKNAQSNGINADDLIKASGGGQIWEETLRKFQGEQLRSQLEVHGQAALTDILAQVERKELTDPNEIKQKFESAVTGFEKPLANISPESAVRFKQSMGATAGAFYKEATKKLTADYLIDQQILTEENLIYSARAAKAMIATISDPAQLDEVENLLFRRVYEQAREGGTDFAKMKANEFKKEFKSIKLNYFAEVATSSEYSKDMVTAVKRINAGDFGEKTDLYKSLPIEEQKKVRDLSVSAWTDVYAATKKQQELNKIENKEKDDADVISMFKLKDGKEKISIAQDLYKRDVITLDTLKGIISPKDEGNGDPLTKARAMSDVIFGKITSEKQLISLYPNLNIKQRADLIEAIANKQVVRGQTKIRIRAGASENPYAAIDIPTAGKIQIMNDLADDFKAATNPDGSAKYTYDEAINEAIKQFPKEENVVKNKTTQTTKNQYFVKNYPDFNPDTMTPSGYGKFKKLDTTAIDNLTKQHNVYIEAKKITGLSAGQL